MVNGRYDEHHLYGSLDLYLIAIRKQFSHHSEAGDHL